VPYAGRIIRIVDDTYRVTNILLPTIYSINGTGHDTGTVETATYIISYITYWSTLAPIGGGGGNQYPQMSVKSPQFKI